MFCILEGVDGGGKSTVAIRLMSELDRLGYSVELMHRGVPERDVLEEYQLDVEDYRPLKTRPKMQQNEWPIEVTPPSTSTEGKPPGSQGDALIADRWHWGEIVYGELYRGTSALGGSSGGTFRYVELFLRSRGAVTVLVENEKDEILRRLRSRGEDYLREEHVGHVLSHYRDVFEASATGVMITSEPDPDAIIKHAEYWAGATAALAPFPTYIGGRTPRVLLVGDKRSDPDGPSMTAFRPGKGNNGSGAFLLEALPAPLWGEVGICNANEEEDLPALLDVLADPPVVALGHEASKALRKQGIEHSAVPHPAKIRRFHFSEKVNYGQLVQRIIGTNNKEFSWPR